MSSQLESDSLEFCSMDYWDYFVELECLQNAKGKDLQLAAELGKTLLERNKELETGLKQQQTVIDDQSQEIEYLSKQSAALREVNDSRLRVYEQLEVSIQELEVTNQRLTLEAAGDQRRIRSLTQTVESQEQRTAELQALVEELRSAQSATQHSASQQRRHAGRRDSETEVPGASDQLAERVALLERQLDEAAERERQERERRQWAEAEVSAAQEESSELRREMAALRERSVKLHTLAEEVHAMEEHRLSPVLRHHGSPRPCSASPQLEATTTEPQRSVWGEDCARWPAGDAVSAPASLISDLDAHYRLLLDHMDKHEWRLTARPARPASPGPADSLCLLDELRLSEGQPGPPLPPLPRDSGPASLLLLGAPSEGDASSSGFSEGSEASRAVSRATQTPDPAPAGPQRGRPAAPRPHTPQYKQLFQEIFEVLKQPVAVPPVMCSVAVTTATDPSVASALATAATAEVDVVRPIEATADTEKVAAAQASAKLTEVTEAEMEFHVLSPPRVTASETSASEDDSLQATLPVDTLTETVSPVHPSPESPARTPAGPSRSGSVARTFSYAAEYARRLRASTPAGSDGGDPCEEFPLLVRPSEEVAKLRLLERSYAEALKAGRRCFYRPTLL